MKHFVLAAGVLLAAGTGQQAQSGTLYALNNGTNTLHSFDTDTLTQTLIGPLGAEVTFAGAAWDPGAMVLYMIGGRGNNNLYTVNTSTGASTLVGNHGVRDLFGLAFDSMNGVLYGSQFSGGSGLYSLNTGTGAATQINPSMATGIGGLSYDSLNDRLVGVHDGSGVLYDIDRSDGTQLLLSGSPGNNDSGLTYDPDKDLFWDIDYSGNLFSYDPNNGYARTTHLTGLGNFDGMAYAAVGGTPPPPNPIPVPFSLPLMASAVGVLAFLRLRRAS